MTSLISLVMIANSLKEGLQVYRGQREKGGREYASDAGDLGRGIYYTTSRARASCYGTVSEHVVIFENPMVVSVETAYNIACAYGVFSPHGGPPKIDGATVMTEAMLAFGYDGLASVRTIAGETEIEIVDYRPYRK
jgi:hypothetical protein